MSGNKEIKLGQKAEDIVSGFAGIIDHIAEYPFQNRRVALLPDSLDKDGNTKKGLMFDESQIRIVDKKQILSPTFGSPLYEWGQPVRDTFTGYEGKVIGRAIYLNGCVRICVQAAHDKKKDVPFDEGNWFPEGQVVPVGKLLKKKEDRPQASKRPGGPTSTRSSWR